MRPIVLRIGSLALMKNRECYETNFSGRCSVSYMLSTIAGCTLVEYLSNWAMNPMVGLDFWCLA